MPERVRILVPTAFVNAGDRLVLCGPGTDGLLDLEARMDGPREARICVQGEGDNEPAGLEECRFEVMVSQPVVYGRKQFAVLRVDRESGLVSTEPPQVTSVFVNGVPGAARYFRPVDIPGDRLRFSFSPGQFV